MLEGKNMVKVVTPATFTHSISVWTVQDLATGFDTTSGQQFSHENNTAVAITVFHYLLRLLHLDDRSERHRDDAVPGVFPWFGGWYRDSVRKQEDKTHKTGRSATKQLTVVTHCAQQIRHKDRSFVLPPQDPTQPDALTHHTKYADRFSLSLLARHTSVRARVERQRGGCL